MDLFAQIRLVMIKFQKDKTTMQAKILDSDISNMIISSIVGLLLPPQPFCQTPRL